MAMSAFLLLMLKRNHVILTSSLCGSAWQWEKTYWINRDY